MSVGTTALTAVATGLYATLANDHAHRALVPGGIWDHAPQDPTFPLEYLRDFEEEPEDTAGLQCRVVKGSLHIYSTYAGMTEAYAILDSAVALLRQTAIALVGWAHDATLYDGAVQADPELDDANVQYQHLVARFRVFVMEA